MPFMLFKAPSLIGSRSRWAQMILVISIQGVLFTQGCGGPPAAASNEVFTPTQAFGSKGPEMVAQQPALNDVLASRVLDSSERTQVWAALASSVHGTVRPLEQAEHGIRFSDVPRAAITAASAVEMAVVSTQRLRPEVQVKYTDEDGYLATMKIVLDQRLGLVSVAYQVPNESASLPAARMRASMTSALTRLRTLESAQVLASAREVIKQNGATIVDIREVPDRYEIELLMLDSQPAGLRVSRLDSSKVLEWQTWAGVFTQREAAKKLGQAFESALREWGRVPGYLQGE